MIHYIDKKEFNIHGEFIGFDLLQIKPSFYQLVITFVGRQFIT